jgi:hypothetical protein
LGVVEHVVLASGEPDRRACQTERMLEVVRTSRFAFRDQLRRLTQRLVPLADIEVRSSQRAARVRRSDAPQAIAHTHRFSEQLTRPAQVAVHPVHCSEVVVRTRRLRRIHSERNLDALLQIVEAAAVTEAKASHSDVVARMSAYFVQPEGSGDQEGLPPAAGAELHGLRG